MTTTIEPSDTQIAAAVEAIKQRLSWPSLHWGAETLHPDALPHIARAALVGAQSVEEPVDQDTILRAALAEWEYDNEMQKDFGRAPSIWEDSPEWAQNTYLARVARGLEAARQYPSQAGQEPAPDPLIDQHGDIWSPGPDGLLHTPETRPFTRAYVEKKWGPLAPAPRHTHSPGNVPDPGKCAGCDSTRKSWQQAAQEGR